MYEHESIDEKHKTIILELLAYTVKALNLKTTTLRIFKTILEFNRTSNGSWRRIIELLIERKKYKKALEFCKEASSVLPNDLWFLKQQININDWKTSHDDVEFREILAKFYDRAGSHDKAQILYKQVLMLDCANKSTQRRIKACLKDIEKKLLINKYDGQLEDIYNDNIPKKKGAYTYFFLAEQLNRMKIGWSGEPPKRIKNFQTGSAEKLKLIAYVKGNIEKELHDQFEDYKIRREWYEPATEILYKIIELLMREKGVFNYYSYRIPKWN